MNIREKIKSIVEDSPSARKIALATVAGGVAISAVGCGGGSGEGGSFSMPEIGGSSVPYGSECINHPNHLEAALPVEERGHLVGTYGAVVMGDLATLVEEGIYTPDGEATDYYGQLMVEAISEGPLLNSTRKPAPGQEEQALESFRLLQENFDKERYLEENPSGMGDIAWYNDMLPISAHAYGENSSKDDEYKICVAYPEPDVHEEYKK